MATPLTAAASARGGTPRYGERPTFLTSDNAHMLASLFNRQVVLESDMVLSLGQKRQDVFVCFRSTG